MLWFLTSSVCPLWPHNRLAPLLSRGFVVRAQSPLSPSGKTGSTMALTVPGRPEQGQLVDIRQRQYVVTDVVRSTLPGDPLQPPAPTGGDAPDRLDAFLDAVRRG